MGYSWGIRPLYRPSRAKEPRGLPRPPRPWEPTGSLMRGWVGWSLASHVRDGRASPIGRPQRSCGLPRAARHARKRGPSPTEWVDRSPVQRAFRAIIAYETCPRALQLRWRCSLDTSVTPSRAPSFGWKRRGLHALPQLRCAQGIQALHNVPLDVVEASSRVRFDGYRP